MDLVTGKKTARWTSNVTVRSNYRLWAALLLCPLAVAQTLTFEIGRPVAAQDFLFKSAAFVFRMSGCADPAKLEVSASEEGIVNTQRRSVLLMVRESRTNPGVYAVPQRMNPGNWVIVLKGSCGNLHAGAIVPGGPSGFVRDATKFYPRAATPAEIEAALRAFPEGGYK
jgi:hypothetical protein